MQTHGRLCNEQNEYHALSYAQTSGWFCAFARVCNSAEANTHPAVTSKHRREVQPSATCNALARAVRPLGKPWSWNLLRITATTAMCQAPNIKKANEQQGKLHILYSPYPHGEAVKKALVYYYRHTTQSTT